MSYNSIEAYKSALFNGTIKKQHERILAILHVYGPELAALEIKEILFGLTTESKKRTDIDNAMSTLYFKGLVDRKEDGKIIDGMMQSVYSIPPVPHKTSEGLQRELLHVRRAEVRMATRKLDLESRLTAALIRRD